MIEWQGHVVRVDGDHTEDNDDDPDYETFQKHYQTHSTAEIFIRMDQPLRGMFYNSDYDLLLVLDSEHFTRNLDVLYQL